MSRLVRGRIVYVETPDPQGRNPKARPAVVLTSTEEITEDGEVVLVAISSRLDAAPTEAQVELPWPAQGRCPTKCTRPSVAVCTWLFSAPVASIREQDVGGVVPGGKLLQILGRVASLSGGEPGGGEQEPS